MTTEKTTANEETPASAATDKAAATEAKKTRDPIKHWTAVVLVCCALLFVWHILGDKFTPYTSNGRIEAFIVPIAPQVPGILTQMYATNNQLVAAGQELAVLDPTKYALAVKRAEADLQQASQASSADVAAVTTAQARVVEAEANLRNAEVKGKRIIKLSKQGAASMARADDARTRIEASKANLASARSELEKAKSNLGTAGLDNARIRSATAALETAELELYRTIIRAPSEGIITNLTVDAGQFANAGTPIMTFISTKEIWIQADIRENSLGNIKQGDPVELVLDAAPGRIFNGVVMSVGYGVADSSANTVGGLTSVQTSQGWLRQAQSFPVLIHFADDQAKNFIRAGGQVNAIIYTGDHLILNTLGRLRVRLVSFLSHIY